MFTLATEMVDVGPEGVQVAKEAKEVLRTTTNAVHVEVLQMEIIRSTQGNLLHMSTAARKLSKQNA